MAEAFVGFLILWSCLKEQEVVKKSYAKQGQRKTFAQALDNTCDIPFSQLPTPCIKRDMVVFRVEEEDYLTGLDDCKNHLHGGIILSKGDKPLTHLDLTKKLQLVWKTLRPWKVIPLGKGFYEFKFSSLEDMRCVLGVGSWQLSHGLLRLFSWQKILSYLL